MREFYFVVEPIVSKPEKDMRVYRIEKSRKGQGSYREAFRMAGGDIGAEKGNKTRQSMEDMAESPQEYFMQSPNSNTIEAQMLMQPICSLEERQELLQYRKRVQESSGRRSQMLAAYGKK